MPWSRTCLASLSDEDDDGEITTRRFGATHFLEIGFFERADWSYLRFLVVASGGSCGRLLITWVGVGAWQLMIGSMEMPE